MALLQLATEDLELLREILEVRLKELATEINRTDHFDLKRDLRVRARAIERIVQQINTSGSVLQKT